MLKKILHTLIIITILLTMSNPFASMANSQNEARILYNGNELATDVKPVTINSRIMLPMRVVFEAFGAEIIWDNATKTATGKKEDITVTVRVGQEYAYVNNRKVWLDSPAAIISGRTLVPLRFVAEAFNMEVTWDGKTKVASIKDEIYLASSYKLNVGNKELFIGQSEEQLVKLFGLPVRIDPDKSDFDWYIYNSQYSRYLQVGVRKGMVVAVYTNSADLVLDNKLRFGMEMEEIKAAYNEKASFFDNCLTMNEQAVLIKAFIDMHENNKLTSLLITKKNIPMRSSVDNEFNTRVLKSYELQLMDMANSVRIRYGIPAFTWSEKLADVARLHSIDMVEKGYFSHTNKEGESSFDRIRKIGLNFRLAAENIAMGYENAIFAHEAWMNSSGHRRNILCTATHFGAGVASNTEGYLYYTQNFYTPME